VTSGSRGNAAAIRRRIARRRRASATDRVRYAASRVASDLGEPSKGSAAREEVREDLLAEESSESGDALRG